MPKNRQLQITAASAKLELIEGSLLLAAQSESTSENSFARVDPTLASYEIRNGVVTVPSPEEGTFECALVSLTARRLQDDRILFISLCSPGFPLVLVQSDLDRGLVTTHLNCEDIFRIDLLASESAPPQQPFLDVILGRFTVRLRGKDGGPITLLGNLVHFRFLFGTLQQIVIRRE